MHRRHCNPKGHLGWKNYETWAVALWIGNDESTQRYWHRQARALKSRGDREAVNNLAEELKDSFEEDVPELEGVYADLLGVALGEVDWYEVAESLFDE